MISSNFPGSTTKIRCKVFIVCTFFHIAIGFNHSLLQVVTNSLILFGWIKHTKKGIVCQENRVLVITNSNHAYFVKILGRGFQEEVKQGSLSEMWPRSK